MQAAQQKIAKGNSSLTSVPEALFVLFGVGYAHVVQLKIAEATERKTGNRAFHCGTVVCYKDVPAQNHSHGLDVLQLARSNEKIQL